MKPKFCRHRARRQVMRAAERRQEVIERVLVRQIDRRQLQADFVLVASEHVVVSDRKIKDMPGRNAWRVLVVVLGTRQGNLQQR